MGISVSVTIRLMLLIFQRMIASVTTTQKVSSVNGDIDHDKF